MEEVLKEIRDLLKKQNELLEQMKNLFEKYDDEYLKEVEVDGIIKQE
jgi:hypothetical protein